MSPSSRALLTEWKPAYKRGFAMQASLAIVGGLFGLIAWWQSGDWRWLAGAALLVANWPYTLIAIMPTNNRLMATPVDQAGPESRPDRAMGAPACGAHRARGTRHRHLPPGEPRLGPAGLGSPRLDRPARSMTLM